MKIGDVIGALERLRAEHGDEVEVLAYSRKDHGAGPFAWMAELDFRFEEHGIVMLWDDDDDDFREDWQGAARAGYRARTLIISAKD